MSRYEFKWIDDKNLQIIGTIDENFDFECEVKKFKDEVFIDLQGVKRINSCGVREWIKGILKTESRLHFVNCSSVIVAQFSMIPEFLGKNGVVDSFETQFICEACGHEDTKILTVGVDIEAGKEVYDQGPVIECSECQSTMECDHNPELYFSFLSDAG